MGVISRGVESRGQSPCLTLAYPYFSSSMANSKESAVPMGIVSPIECPESYIKSYRMIPEANLPVFTLFCFSHPEIAYFTLKFHTGHQIKPNICRKKLFLDTYCTLETDTESEASFIQFFLHSKAHFQLNIYGSCKLQHLLCARYQYQHLLFTHTEYFDIQLLLHVA